MFFVSLTMYMNHLRNSIRVMSECSMIPLAEVLPVALLRVDDNDGVGGTGSVFLLLDEPEVYGLPPDPRVPTADLPRMFNRASLAAVGMIAAAAISFLTGRRR